MRLGVVRVIFQLPVNTRKFSTRLAAVPQQPGVYVHRDKDSNVIYDRGVLDNIASTLWAYSNKVDGVDDDFVEKCLDFVKIF